MWPIRDEPIAADACDLHLVGLTFARDVVGARPTR
jgi:hypothetical protein